MRISRYWHSQLLLALGLAWSLPAGAAVLNSVQTGTVTMTAAVQSVTITSVNTARAFVICQFATGGNGSNATGRVTCELNAAATLTITAGAVDATETVRWYVVEFLSGVTVQRGLANIAAAAPATTNIVIAAVNLASTFVIVTERTASASQTIDEQFTTRALLTTATNLQLIRNATATAESVAWQVVQIDASAVQSGTVTILQNATAATVSLAANPVDTGRTFLVFSRSGGSATGGNEQYYQTRGEITNSTTLTFTRAFQNNTANTQVDIAWFAVRMTDGTTVQRGTVATAAVTDATLNAALAPAIVINRSVPIISVSDDPASGTPTADLDDMSWLTAFTSTTNLQFTRPNSSHTSNATIAWFVIQFANVVNLIDRREIFP